MATVVAINKGDSSVVNRDSLSRRLGHVVTKIGTFCHEDWNIFSRRLGRVVMKIGTSFHEDWDFCHQD